MKKDKKLTVISFLLSVVCLSVYAETVTNNLDVQGGFIYNHGVVNPGDVGLTFTNIGIRDITVSAGQLSGVDPETGAVITNSANLLPLKAQSLTAASNITAGGTFIGNGSGLTNLNIGFSTGRISTASLPTSGVWNASGIIITNATLAGSTQTSLTVTSNLTVQGTINGNGSGLSSVAAGGNNGELQFNSNGTLAGNTNFFMHPTEHKLAFRSQGGNFFRGYNSETIADTNLIYSLRNEDGTSVLRLRENGQDTIRLSGDGSAYIKGNLQLDGQLIADGSGITNLPVQAQVDAIIAAVSNSPAATITTNDIASWNSGGALAASVQVSTQTVSITTNLTVQGTISGNGSGLSSVAAGGNSGDLQFNENGVLAGNTNFFMHPTEHKLAFRSQNGNIFRAYSSESITDSNLIYSLRNEDGTTVLRLRQNGQDTVRLSGDGDAYIAGNLQLTGQLIADGSGLTNLPVQAQVDALVAAVSNSPAASITTNQIASWSSGGELAASVQASGQAVNITTNLTVQGTISGDGSGLTNLPEADPIFIAAVEQMVSTNAAKVPSSAAAGNAIAAAMSAVSGLDLLLTNTQGDVAALIGNISNSYVVVNGVVLPFDMWTGNRPTYLSHEIAGLSYHQPTGMWKYSDTGGLTLHNSSQSYLPPTIGWLDSTGGVANITVKFVPGSVANEEARAMAAEATKLGTNAISQTIGTSTTNVPSEAAVHAAIVAIPAATITTNQIASWNSGGTLAESVQVSTGTVNITTNLTVQGTISGNGSGLSSVAAGGSDGQLQFNANGVLAGNTNYFIHPTEHKLAFRSPTGNIFRAYNSETISDNNLIYSLRNEDGTSVLRLRENGQDTIRLSGDGTAYIKGNLQLDGQLVADGSGLTNLPVQAQVDALIAAVSNSPAATITTNQIASWNSGGVLAASVQFSGGTVNITTNLTVWGTISGDGSGLTQLNATNLVGKISTNQLPLEALQGDGILYATVTNIVVFGSQGGDGSYRQVGFENGHPCYKTTGGTNEYGNFNKVRCDIAGEWEIQATNGLFLVNTSGSYDAPPDGWKYSDHWTFTNEAPEVSISFVEQTTAIYPGDIMRLSDFTSADVYSAAYVSKAYWAHDASQADFLTDGNGDSFSADFFVRSIVVNGVTNTPYSGAITLPDMASSSSILTVSQQVTDMQSTLTSALAGHVMETNNPHHVTAAQVGAYTKTETDAAIAAIPATGVTNAMLLDGTRAMQASLDMGGHSVTNVGAITLQTNLTVHGLLIATHVPKQGDLSMGSYTNGLPQ